MSIDARDEAPRNNDFWTEEEFGRMLSVSRSTLRRWRKRGTGPKFIRESAQTIVYLKKSVLAWLKRRERRIQVSYPKVKAAARKREAAKRAKRAAPSNVTPIKRRRRSTRADKSAAPATESPGA